MNHTFETPDPIQLAIELGSGDVTVTATDTTTTTVTLSGPEAEDTQVTQHGRTISVIAPKRKVRLFGSGGLTVVAQVPLHSDVSTGAGSADVDIKGQVSKVDVKAGSGDLSVEHAGDVDAVSGSGTQRLGTLEGGLRARTGSGDVRAHQIAGDASVASGSGDFVLENVGGSLSGKTGSGDIVVNRLGGDADISTASGDISVHRMEAGTAAVRTASGNIRLGAGAGTPVWTDITSVSGRVASDLQSLGEPTEGQPYLQWRLRSVSGDIHLSHV